MSEAQLTKSLAKTRNTFDVACSLFAQNKYEEAEKLMWKVVRKQQKGLGSNHLTTLDSTQWLGRSLCLQRKYDQAETLLQNAVLQCDTAYKSHHIVQSIEHWLRYANNGRKDVPTCFHAGTNATVEKYACYSTECVYCRLVLQAINEFYPGWTTSQGQLKSVEILDLKISCRSQPFVEVRLAGEDLGRYESNHLEIRIDTC